MIEIVEVHDVTDELIEATKCLIPQLSSFYPPPTRLQLQEIVASDSTVLFVARDAVQAGKIVGMLTLVVFRIPTGLRSRFEDVVVDAEARRRGVGKLLSRAALQRARERGTDSVDLTSRPSREDANQLYRSIGFVRRHTNVYRYQFEGRGASRNVV